MSLSQVQISANRVALRYEDQFVRSLVSNYREAVRDIRSELAGLYERYAVGGKLTNAQMTRYNRLSKMDAQLTEALGPHIRSANTTIRRLAGSQYEEAFYRAAWSYDNELRTSLKWGQIPIEQVKAAVANPMAELALRELPIHTLNRVRRAVAQGLIRGLSMPKMMRGIRDAMGTTTADAMRIARTEAHRAREVGHLAASQSAAEQGVDLMRVWDAALDDRTRSSHARLDGEKATPTGRFPGGPIAPGLWGIAGEDINCRCRATDVIEGYEPQGRRIQGEVQEYKTFGAWAKEHGITGNKYGQRYNFIRS